MNTIIEKTVLFAFAMLLVWGCKVTEEKIELWKSTQNGSDKIAEVLADAQADPKLRSAAAIALIETKEHALLTDTMKSLSSSDADIVIEAAAPALAAIVDDKKNPNDVRSEQITAKDGLFLLYDFSGPKSKQAVEDALVQWCTQGNFNARERAGFNIRVIINKVGAPMYQALAKQLTFNQNALLPLAKIIRDSQDKDAITEASLTIVNELKTNLQKITKSHLTAAAAIGAKPVADFLVALATVPNKNHEIGKFALRAYSFSIEVKTITAQKEHIEQLIILAQNEQTPKFYREETYLTLAQMPSPHTAAALRQLLQNSEFFWRMVGVRCLLRLDGKTHLDPILSTKELTTDDVETKELIELVASFPKLKNSFKDLLQSSNGFAKGVAIYALATLGNKSDAKSLIQLQSNKQKLPLGFSDKTVGAAASSAIEMLEKKG